MTADPLSVLGFLGMCALGVSGGVLLAACWCELRAWLRRRRARLVREAQRAERRSGLSVIHGGLSPGDSRARELSGPPAWRWPERP